MSRYFSLFLLVLLCVIFQVESRSHSSIRVNEALEQHDNAPPRPYSPPVAKAVSPKPAAPVQPVPANPIFAKQLMKKMLSMRVVPNTLWNLTAPIRPNPALTDAFKAYQKRVADIQKIKSALNAYQKRVKAGPGRVYGDSVRKYNLQNKSFRQISNELTTPPYLCKKDETFIKNATTAQPIVGPNGKNIRMVQFICPDGGAFRVKPDGDPSNKFRPQPISSKALRWPYTAPFLTFDDEVVKVDNAGNIIPKWKNDMDVSMFGPHVGPALDQWADIAHTDLRLEK